MKRRKGHHPRFAIVGEGAICMLQGATDFPSTFLRSRFSQPGRERAELRTVQSSHLFSIFARRLLAGCYIARARVISESAFCEARYVVATYALVCDHDTNVALRTRRTDEAMRRNDAGHNAALRFSRNRVSRTDTSKIELDVDAT